MRVTEVRHFGRRSFQKLQWVVRWNNFWQEHRWRRVRNKQIVEKIQEKGFKVYEPAVHFTNHLAL